MAGRSAAGYRLIITEYCKITPEEAAAFSEVCQVETEDKVITAYNEQPADIIILGYGRGHENAADTAVYIAEHSAAAVMVLFAEDAPSSVLRRCAESGVVYAHRTGLRLMAPALKAMRTRLKGYETRETTLQKKLDDTRLVNRAKLLLISRLKMSETEAHRYIEKTAMDTGSKRSDVAQSIIRTYED